MAKRQRIIGKIDSVSDGFLRGWVVDLSYPRRRQCVDVFAGRNFLGQAACGFRRPDLEALGFGDGRHEFLFALGASDIDEKDICLRVSSAPHVVLRVDSGDLPEEVPPLPSRARWREYFETLIAGLSRDLSIVAGARSQHELLVASTLRHGVPISNFASHIASKFGYKIGDHSVFNDFLYFYYETYSPYKAPARIPLAKDEVAYWSTGGFRDIPRAALAFAPVDSKPDALVRNFEWAVNDAARLCLEDAGIGDRTGDYLSGWRFPFSEDSKFPINNFLWLFVKQNAALDSLRGFSLESRQLMYVAAILHAVRARHLFEFLPSRWVESLVQPRQGRDCDMVDLLTKVLGHRPDVTAVIDATAASLGAPAASPEPSPPKRVDVQLIGPFDRVLGLSESCRRLARAVAACGYEVAFANYDINNASPRDGRAAVSERLASARINVLHLNLEEVPEALAFSLAPIVGSYIVAVPYFELSAPAACHELGLKLVDEIWSPTLFLKSLFAPKSRATHLIPLPRRDDMRRDRAAARAGLLAKIARADPVTLFLSTADALSWVARKNVMGSIDAFQAAFQGDEKVCLIVKTLNIEKISNPSGRETWKEIAARAEADARIVLMNELLDDEDYTRLLSGIDCFVSLHRSEGLGLDILDAMTIGTSVIATAYSGNVDLCDETTSWPVECDLVPVGEGNYPFAELTHEWAEPRLASAVSALRDVYMRPDERKRRAASAEIRVAEVNDVRSVAAKIGARVRDILDDLEISRQSAMSQG